MSEKSEQDNEDKLSVKNLSSFSNANLSQDLVDDVNLNSHSFWLGSLPKIARKNKMNIEHAKKTMEFLDKLFSKRFQKDTKQDKEKLTSTESRRINGKAITKRRRRKNKYVREKVKTEESQMDIVPTCSYISTDKFREENNSKNSENKLLYDNEMKATDQRDRKNEKTTQPENFEISLAKQESPEDEDEETLKENYTINDDIQNFENVQKKEIKPMKPDKREDETLEDRKEKNEFFKFLQFLGIEHKKKNQKKDIEKIENECSIPISDFEQLFAKKEDKEQLAWKQLKTVKYERDVLFFGTTTNISWQVEKDIKFQDDINNKNADSSKVNYIPQKELIENDIKNQTLQKFTSEVEENDKLYSHTPKWDGKINDKNGHLPDQRIFKNQKQNWLLDMDPWLADEEPWKTMEAEKKCFSLKLIPDNILNITENPKVEKNEIVQKKCEEEIVNKIGRKKLMLQKYLTTQEENLFNELKIEAEKNYHELNKNLLLSEKLNDFERKCCKVYKKSHKCKRLPMKQKQNENKTAKQIPDDVRNEDKQIRTDYCLELYSRILEDSGKLASQKYSEEEKPLHPLFGSKAILAKQFIKKEKTQFSSCHKDTTKEIYKKMSKSQPKRNFKLNKREKEIKRPLKPCPITINPLQKFKFEKVDLKESVLTNREKLSELQWVIKEEKNNVSEVEDEFNLKFVNLKIH